MSNPEALAPCPHKEGDSHWFRWDPYEGRNVWNPLEAKCKGCGKSIEQLLNLGAPPRTYDSDVAALAPMLPDGWYLQNIHGDLCWCADPEKPTYDESGWKCIAYTIPHPLVITKTESATSLRRIQGGKVID